MRSTNTYVGGATRQN